MIVYAAQDDVVIETLKTSDYYVRRHFVEKKYGEVANVMLKVYDWFVLEMKKQVDQPLTSDYPIWLFLEPTYAKGHPTQRLITLDIPEDCLILFDRSGWEKVLSLSYVPKNIEDEKVFNNQLKSQGIDCCYTLFEKPYYPLLKKTVENSWKRIFKGKTQAAVWYLKSSWIKEIE